MTTVLESLNQALSRALERDRSVVVLGEDILDPYGGAFKVTRGLSSRFPDSVWTTPVSEAAIVGVAGGMALGGLRPVVEIMFGDFLTLATDAIVNSLSKYPWMYGEGVIAPVVVRAPSGGYRGYGPTHSQSLEKMFLGVPCLDVIAPNVLSDPGLLLERAIFESRGPTLFVEHKLLYPRSLRLSEEGRLGSWWVRFDTSAYPMGLCSLCPFDRADVTLACYSYLAEEALASAEALLVEEEIVVEVVVFSDLKPRELSLALESVRRSGRLAILEEGTRTGGWGAEIVARVAETLGRKRALAASRIAALDLPIACSPTLEEEILPSGKRLRSELRRLAGD